MLVNQCRNETGFHKYCYLKNLWYLFTSLAWHWIIPRLPRFSGLQGKKENSVSYFEIMDDEALLNFDRERIVKESEFVVYYN